jgi:hypothetical protein
MHRLFAWRLHGRKVPSNEQLTAVLVARFVQCNFMASLETTEKHG